MMRKRNVVNALGLTGAATLGIGALGIAPALADDTNCVGNTCMKVWGNGDWVDSFEGQFYATGAAHNGQLRIIGPNGWQKSGAETDCSADCYFHLDMHRHVTYGQYCSAWFDIFHYPDGHTTTTQYGGWACVSVEP